VHKLVTYLRCILLFDSAQRLLEQSTFTDETCLKLLAVRNCRIMSAPNIGLDQVGASAERPSQGTERAADAALDESHNHSSVHGSLKRSASEALAPISSSDEDLSDADLEPKKKKRKSTAAAQQQQLQQAVGSVNNSCAADSMTSHWAFVEAALSDYDTESDADYNDAIKRSKSPWYTQNEKSMKDVFAFIGDGHYSVLATVCKAWCAAYCIDERSPKERIPGTSYIENSRQTRSTYYQLLLHNDKLLKALWHPDMASLDWNDSDDGR
jgi:hypothetical protein